MKAGSLEKPEQFVVVDDHTFRVDFIRKDKLTMPDLAVIVPGVYHSELVKKSATEKDPWGLEYTKTNIAGGGAYKVIALEGRHRGRLRPQRRLEERAAAEGQARRLAHRAVGRQPARAARARRCRHLRTSCPTRTSSSCKQAGKVDVVTDADRQRHLATSA